MADNLPALTFDLTRKPRTAWLWFAARRPALTLLLTRSPLTGWLWLRLKLRL